MGVICVVGLQWGDEGKGKIVDVLSRNVDIVVRYQGGANAGHTVVIGGEKFVLHQIPSGILHPGKRCVIANGVALDLELLVKEIEDLKHRRIWVGKNLLISQRAHLVMPYHKLFDKLYEKNTGGFKIGTTLHGIGPCYADKAARKGIRMIDIYNKDYFKKRLSSVLEEKNAILSLYHERPLSFQKIFTSWLEYARVLRPYLADTTTYLQSALSKGEKILFEGAHGTMLDIDFGTYPYVTSSSSDACGISYGSGISPKRIDTIVGVAKAYCTRVGEGPFPTELKNKIGGLIRSRGAEFGSTTGRARRCGWFDGVITRYAARINGIDSLAITKLDVLSEFKQIRVCTSYKLGRKIYENVPADLDELAECKPLYRSFKGWKRSLAGIKNYEELPPQARRFLEFIEDFIGIKIKIISIGSGREQLIFR
jgi:adenylosuccinate synthase